MAAECLPPAVAQQQIHQAAVRAVGRLRAGKAPEPFHLQPPVTAAIEFVHSEMADAAAILPGAQRTGGKRIDVTADDMPTAYRAFRVAIALAR